MTSGEKLLAFYEIVEMIKSKNIRIIDLNGIDLALIVSDLGYDISRIYAKF